MAIPCERILSMVCLHDKPVTILDIASDIYREYSSIPFMDVTMSVGEVLKEAAKIGLLKEHENYYYLTDYRSAEASDKESSNTSAVTPDTQSSTQFVSRRNKRKRRTKRRGSDDEDDMVYYSDYEDPDDEYAEEYSNDEGTDYDVDSDQSASESEISETEALYALINELEHIVEKQGGARAHCGSQCTHTRVAAADADKVATAKRSAVKKAPTVGKVRKSIHNSHVDTTEDAVADSAEAPPASTEDHPRGRKSVRGAKQPPKQKAKSQNRVANPQKSKRRTRQPKIEEEDKGQNDGHSPTCPLNCDKCYDAVCERSKMKAQSTPKAGNPPKSTRRIAQARRRITKKN